MTRRAICLFLMPALALIPLPGFHCQAQSSATGTSIGIVVVSMAESASRGWAVRAERYFNFLRNTLRQAQTRSAIGTAFNLSPRQAADYGRNLEQRPARDPRCF